MAEELEKSKPLIIKRVKKKGHDFHGGSWKVAFADFATAMMAFFLLLWLIGTTSEEEKKAISGYFADPQGMIERTNAGSGIVGDGGANSGVIDLGAVKPDTIDDDEEDEKENEKILTEEALEKIAEEKELARLKVLRDTLKSMVENSQAFSQLKEQVIIDITPAGLRIQIVDKDKRPMFDSGSAEPKGYSKTILKKLAGVLKQVPNKLSITGHTDATPYLERDDYGNWELSADRANSARRELSKGGIKDTQIARVEGFASSILFNKMKPHDPINRRIAIIVLKRSVAEEIEKQVLGIE